MVSFVNTKIASTSFKLSCVLDPVNILRWQVKCTILLSALERNYKKSKAGRIDYTETGRPRIQIYAWQLILAPNVNDFGYVALFV